MRKFKDHIFICDKSELYTLLQESFFQQSVIVMSEQSSRRYGFDSLLKQLSKQNGIIWISSFSPNPTQADLKKSLEQIGSFPFHHILAIGGGSAIDLAKGILALYKKKESHTEIPSLKAITKYIIEKNYVDNSSLISFTAVPTTAGTGSEVTSWATFWDVNSAAKYSIDAPWLVPESVYLVPELTETLPKRLTASTGLDALSHAMEAYWAKATNPAVKGLSLEAVKKIIYYLPLAVTDSTEPNVREELLLAACTSGLAFSQTRTTACHSISYPLTYLYHIEHGFAVALTLPQIAAINQQAVPDIEQLLHCFVTYGGISPWLQTVCRGITPLRLSSWGITEADIPKIVEHAFTKGRMDNNPVPLTKQDVTQILLRCL